MRCEECGEEARTVDSKLRARDGVRRRRYECPACGARATTYEVPERTWSTWSALERTVRRGSGLLRAALHAVSSR